MEYKQFIYYLFIWYIFNSIFKKLKRNIIKICNIKNLFYLPYVSLYIKKSLKKVTLSIEDGFKNNYNNIKYLPDKQIDKKEIDKKINELKELDNYTNKISGTVYSGDKEYCKKIVEVFEKFTWTNPLHPDLFTSIREMEVDIINMVKSMFYGDENCSGNLSYGGTESILLACKTYRDWGYHEKGITNPNIVVLESVHPAFDKACHYFNIKIIKVPVLIETGTNNIYEIENYVDSNTVCLVGSAPSYPHGIIDPIEEMSKLAYKKNIGMHVDCCLGGFLVPFLKEEEKINVNFDFRLKGVTSISCDTHKYGYSLKGSSVILFRDFNLKQYQHFIYPNWNGGMYATPTVMGSKSGALIASTWASLLYNGRDLYTKYALEIREYLEIIKKRFKYNNDIKIIGNPKVSIIGFYSNKLNIYSIINEMKNRGWFLSVMQNPSAFHLCLTKNHTKEDCNKFCNDLEESISIVKNNKNGKLEGTLAIYGTSTGVQKTIFIKEIINNFIHLLSREKISNKY